MGLARWRVCVPCIIVGLQAYVCFHSSHCKNVGMCWFNFQHVIERNSLKSLAHIFCWKGAFRERNKQTCISAWLSSLQLLCWQSTSVVTAQVTDSNFAIVWNLIWFLACSLPWCMFRKQSTSCSNAESASKGSLGCMKSQLNLIVLPTPTSDTNRWNYLWYIPDSKNTEVHLSRSETTPVLSINTPITHAMRHQCKQCRTIHSGFLAAVALLIGWIDRWRHLML